MLTCDIVVHGTKHQQSIIGGVSCKPQTQDVIIPSNEQKTIAVL
jgi:hypothetical protein